MMLKVSLFVVISMIVMINAEPEAPLRYRPSSQRFAQRPFFARQEAAPGAAGGPPATVYGPPSTTAAPPIVQYGPPVAGSDAESVDTTLTSNETTDNPDAENVVSGQFRSQRLSKLRSQKQQLPQEQIQEGSYFIQLPDGSIQRVTYVSAANAGDQTVSAKLQFRPVVTLAPQPPLLQPIVVNSFVSPF